MTSPTLGRTTRSLRSLLLSCSLSVCISCGGTTERLVELMHQKNLELTQSRQHSQELEDQIVALESERNQLKFQVKKITNDLEATRLEAESVRQKTINTQKITQVNFEQIQALLSEIDGVARVKNGVIIARISESLVLIKYRPKYQVLSAHMIIRAPFDLKMVNVWNKGTFFNRLYLDTKSRVVLESEIDLKVGVHLDSLRQWFKRLRTSLERFEKFLNVMKRGESPKSQAPIQGERI